MERTRRAAGVGVFVAGLVAGMAVAAFGVAGAQTGGTNDEPSAVEPARVKAGVKHGRRMLHGEFTAKDPDGSGYRRLAMQHGEVTSVSQAALTVRSEDGFSRTYAIDEDTRVNRDGTIAEIAEGESVHVLALVEEETFRALRVGDGSARREGRRDGANARQRLRELREAA